MKKTNSKKYTVCLRLGVEKYEVKCDDIVEGIEQIKPEKISLMGLFSIEGDGKRYERKVGKFWVGRLLNGSRINREVFAKNALMVMKPI